jgi:nucleoside phosphorylase
MWNETHSELLRQIILGTDKLKKTQSRLSLSANSVLHNNTRSLDFRELIDLAALDTSKLSSVHTACKFLLHEFGQIWIDADRKHPIYPIIDDKLRVFGHEHGALTHFFTAYEKHQKTKLQLARRGLVDCLFVTAFPTEYLALIRRLDYFIEATDPDTTRGFIDNPSKNKHLPIGWVLGGINRKRKSISAAVVCSPIYGPTGASSAVDQFLMRHSPRHIIVVGVGASLGSPSNFGLGDIAYSTGIDDITLPKYHGGSLESDTQFSSEVTVSSVPQWNKVPEELRLVLSFKNKRLLLTGILQPEHAKSLKSAFSKPEDKKKIESLFLASQRKAEGIDFKTNKVPRRCPTLMVKMAEHVAKSRKWRDGIKLAKPIRSGPPRAVPSRVLSGSAVVKAYGIREQLKKEFKGRLLVEMEGAGVATACRSHHIDNPLVIKSACDWATPEKEKSWQPYCADVAASFALEVALMLAKS